MKRRSISRRGFIQGVAASVGGVSFAFSLSGCRAEFEPTETSTEPELLSWLVIHPDNSATIRVPQTEIGQGVSTTIPQVLADELELDWPGVNFEFYDPGVNAARENVFIWTTAVSSSSAHYLFKPIRTAAAQIRTMLLRAASTQLGVPLEELTAVASRIEHRASGRTLSYAEVAQEASQLEPPSAEGVTLKSPEGYTLIGQPLARLDLDEIVTGEKRYGIDLELPGMRHAAIRQSPVYGAKLIRFDQERLAGMPGRPTAHRVAGARVGYNSPVPEGQDPDLWAATVSTDDALAVVADHWWEAKTALDAVSIEWSDSVHATFSSESLHKTLEERVQSALPVVAETGDFDAAMTQATATQSAVYSYPFMDPAPLEPMNCTAHVDEDEVHVWTNSQFPDDAWRIAYELGEVPPEKAHLHVMPAGGGFGRRLHNDFVHQAVQIAKQNRGTPVKLVWTREETTKHSYYAPLTVARFDGGLDAEGRLSAWRCRVASGFSAEQSYGAARIPFRPPNTRFEYQRDQETPVPFGWMRGVGFTQHHWMNFGFLDELRRLAGTEPMAFYRALLAPEALSADEPNREAAIDRSKRNLRLLDFAIREGAWEAPKPRGSGRGLCVSDSDYYVGYASSTKVAIVDVSLGDGGLPTVDRVFVAIDAGQAINPDVVRAQIEGGVAYALTTALMSEITIERGQVQQSNFHDYPMLRMNQMPSVEIAILPSDAPPTGVGEDAVPVTIAALVNAIADAGGPRIRRLPIGRLT